MQVSFSATFYSPKNEYNWPVKIAVLSDIHGNLPALEAVTEHLAAWRPDRVVVNGDTVNRGPFSLATWQFVQAQLAWQLLKGIHEEYVIGHGKENGATQNGRSRTKQKGINKCLSIS